MCNGVRREVGPLNRNVTLREVAEEAGVHVSTASRALNPETRSIVNDETAKRIRAVAEQLGYRPHPLARALRTQRTLTIGMTVPDLANPIFPMIYAGAGASLAEAGYALVIGSDSLLVDGDDAAAPSGEAAGVFLDDRVDGWIITDALVGSKLPAAISRDEVPVVLVLRSADLIDAPSITPDDELGIRLVVKHLLELGHTAIAHAAGPANSSSGAARRQAFIDRMRSEGLEVPDAAIVQADAFRTEAGREACETLLESGEHFTAIVAADDLIALGCYDALEERGIGVPGQMSVTGFDDMAFIDRVNPPLTTVSVPFYEMGAAAGRVMLSLLTDPEDVARSIDDASARSALSLVVRRSTAAPSFSEG